MPDGVVQWFDAATGKGRILRAGTRYAVDAAQLEPAARHPGARVHFDLEAGRARHAELRPRTRTSPGGGGAGGGPAAEPAATVPEVVVRGEVDPDAVDYARRRLGDVEDRVSAPVLFERLTLTMAPDPARQRPAVAEIMVDVDGTPVRAEVAATTMREAVDLLERRLRDRRDHRMERLEASRRLDQPAGAGEWRHATPPAERPEYFDRPVEDRRVVARTAWSGDELIPDEAVFDLEMLDWDFELFRDLASGDDAVVARLPDGGYALARLHGDAAPMPPTWAPVTLVITPAAVLDTAEAIERLDAGGERYVFYSDRDTGRGRVVYRRYDGHYGVVGPAADAA